MYVNSFWDTILNLRHAIGSYTCSLEASCSLESSLRVTNGVPLGCLLPLTNTTLNSAQPLKVREGLHAYVVPGSGLVKAMAEEEGLDKVRAGFSDGIYPRGGFVALLRLKRACV
jgi:hypothetical protein